jgi:uncharacterized protein YecE (DUF72 family)
MFCIPVSMKKYQEVFQVVELNRTFYRYPKDSTVERWKKESPAGFEFAVKTHQERSHEHRFKSDLAAQAFDKMKKTCLSYRLAHCCFRHLHPSHRAT